MNSQHPSTDRPPRISSSHAALSSSTLLLPLHRLRDRRPPLSEPFFRCRSVPHLARSWVHLHRLPSARMPATAIAHVRHRRTLTPMILPTSPPPKRHHRRNSSSSGSESVRTVVIHGVVAVAPVQKQRRRRSSVGELPWNHSSSSAAMRSVIMFLLALLTFITLFSVLARAQIISASGCTIAMTASDGSTISMQCSNHGVCIGTPQSGRCACYSGFSGAFCESYSECQNDLDCFPRHLQRGHV